MSTVGIEPQTSREGAPGGPAPPTFRQRLHAWWHGYRIVAGEAGAEERPAAVVPMAERDEGAAEEYRAWTPERLQAVELIWGKGFIWPGGADHVLWLVKPIALDPAMSVLDLSAGLGGGARAIVDAFGVWVTGLERSGELAALGMEQSAMAGMEKKASVIHYDPENVDLPQEKYDRVLSREVMFQVRLKEQMLKGIQKTLKRDGQMLVTDYVLREKNLASGAIQRWQDNEGGPLSPWSVEEYEAKFQELGLELRISEDMTDIHCNLVLAGWSRFLHTLDAYKAPPGVILCAVEEAERWASRSAAMKSGDIRLHRFLAIKKEVATMSDW